VYLYREIMTVEYMNVDYSERQNTDWYSAASEHFVDLQEKL